MAKADPKQIKISANLHSRLTSQMSDTNVPLAIGATAEEAIKFHLTRRQLNALIMKTYRAKTLDDARRILREEVATFLGLPEEYLFID